MNIVPDPGQPVQPRLAHPTWCTRVDCDTTGVHTGRWHGIDSGPRQLVDVDLRLTKAIISPAPVWVEVQFRDHAARSTFDLSGGQAIALKHVLGGMLADLR
jgi:hypothetical protein